MKRNADRELSEGVNQQNQWIKYPNSMSSKIVREYYARGVKQSS